jgi:hypothetical protein
MRHTAIVMLLATPLLGSCAPGNKNCHTECCRKQRGVVTFGGASWGGTKASTDILVQFGFAATFRKGLRTIQTNYNCPFNVPVNAPPATAAQKMANAIEIYTFNRCDAAVVNGTKVTMSCTGLSTSNFSFTVAPFNSPENMANHPFPPDERVEFYGFAVTHVPPMGPTLIDDSK